MKALFALLLSMICFLCPRYAWGTGIDFVAEYEGASIIGFKTFFLPDSPWGFEKSILGRKERHDRAKLSVFFGAKSSASEPEGEKYDWSQSRAEDFYKSDFKGYSDKKLSGVNGGILYTLVEERFYVYGGIGFTHSKQYRQYHDDTFTVWSKDYYIEDGMKAELLFDLVFGGNLHVRRLIVGIGYSTAVSNIVLSLGARF